MQNLERFDDKRQLEQLYMQQAEVVMLKSKCEQLMADIQSQNQENLDEKAQLHNMMAQYDEKYALFLQLQDNNQVLQAQQTSISSGMSKDKVLQALKIKA